MNIERDNTTSFKPKDEKNIHPIVIFLSLIVVGVMLTLLMYTIPEQGVKIGNYTLEFPTLSSFFTPRTIADSTERIQKDLAELFDTNVIHQNVDSSLIKHKLDSLRKLRKGLQVTNSSKPAIHRFFDALDNAKENKVRIMHYGDSQIEADRITSYLRDQLQKKFGGYGVGLFSIVQVAPKMSVNTSYSENWKRYTGFGKKDSSVKHNRYGPLINFCRFAPIDNNDTIQHKAWVKIKKPRFSYGKTKSHHQLKLFLSNHHKPIDYEIIADGISVKSGIIKPSTHLDIIETYFDQTPEEILIMFKGNDSPDIYGISLEGKNGVVMDNISLRGSSGTFFTKQDATLLGDAYADLSPNLIILEFGGNTLPYINTEKACVNYGNWFKSQIKFVKKLNPKAAIIVIGPADMSIKNKTEYITYPFLENVRDALKKAALNSNCIFWDMYEVMGGKNSMPKWVKSDPPLAGSDYTHFTKRGAEKVAKEFNKKLFQLYDDYKRSKQEEINP